MLARMELRRMGRTGIRVTELCMGCMTFGREAPESDSREMLDRYFEAGGNFVDTADAYGGGASEEILGRLFAERAGLRDRTVLATKFRMPVSDDPNDSGGSRRHIRTSVEGSLQRLQTDWIDLYQMHAWDPRTPLEETISTLDDLVREGKVRYVGASNYTGWQLATALGVAALHDWEPFVSLQPQYSLVTRASSASCCRCAVTPTSPCCRGARSVAGCSPGSTARARIRRRTAGRATRRRRRS
jgi:aryl-alcohol dehydrogenase-like predicted oxidoreductase